MVLMWKQLRSCQELDALNQKFDESGVECITAHAKFRIVCLDTDVLNTALVAIHNARCNPLPEPIENRLVVLKILPQELFVHCIFRIFLISSRTWRLAAYRQFTWWVHGVLGRKNRRVIPACVVKAIRHEFPEESGDSNGQK